MENVDQEDSFLKYSFHNKIYVKFVFLNQMMQNMIYRFLENVYFLHRKVKFVTQSHENFNNYTKKCRK